MVCITKRVTKQHAEGTDGVLSRLAKKEPTKPKTPRAMLGPKITPENMAKAIRGSCGLIRKVAARLMCKSETVRCWLNKVGHEKYKEMLREEAEGFVDAAEHTVYRSMVQDYDTRTALNAARFVLERKGRDRGWQKEVIIQGGLVHQHQHIIDVTKLDLPIDVRRELLARLEAQNQDVIPAEVVTKALPAPQHSPAPAESSLSVENLVSDDDNDGDGSDDGDPPRPA